MLFHDINYERNRIEHDTFGVYRAVSEYVARSDAVTFLGMPGCGVVVQILPKQEVMSVMTAAPSVPQRWLSHA
jgi:hypothetical protein